MSKELYIPVDTRRQRAVGSRAALLEWPLLSPARQQAYLSALATLPEVEVHWGKFLSKTIWRPLTNLPVAGRRIGSPNPVTMPAGNHLVSGSPTQTLPVGTHRDAWKKSFDVAVVISNDTDLVTPIRMVSLDQGKPVFVVCPSKKRMAAPLAKVATHQRHVRTGMLRASQFPADIPGLSASKPKTW